MRTTVGFDFGTHQTKVCVERRDTGVVEYEFMTFKNSEGKESFFLPSMIQVCADNTLKYGFVDDSPIMEEKPKFGFDKPEPGWTETAQKPESPQLPPQPTPNRLNTVFEQAFYKLEVGKWEKECKKITEKYQKEVERWEQQKNAAYREYAREHAQWADEKDAAYLRYMADCKEWESRNGHLPQKLYRYFKQATFSFKKWENEIEPKLLSIWYMTYLFFEIEEHYGKRFALNMGVPTGKQDGERRKELAVSLVLSAYRLVDDVFRGDKNRFLKCTYTKLQSLTTIIPYSPVAKKKADILVFPEAVACLRPLLQGKKVDEGKMHTMIDIGGGTTDMSFFTVNNGRPHIFSFQSIPHGLNYLTKVDDSSGLVSGGNLRTEIDSQRLAVYHTELGHCVSSLVDELQRSFKQTDYDYAVLYDALKGRPIIYTGGGSTFRQLRKAYQSFSVMLVDHSCWKKDCIAGREEATRFCPLLSTAYGLAIYAKDDNIELSNISTLFAHIRKMDDDDDSGKVNPKHSYHEDWRYKE